MGGSGGAAALIPLLNMIGVPFTLSKATGLFVNVTATSVSTLMNVKHKILDFKFALPLLISLTVFLPVGAFLSQYLNEETMKWMLAVFLLLSSYLLISDKRNRKTTHINKTVLYIIGSSVGLFSGIIGISGGNIIAATLMLLGFDPKKTAVTVSFIVPVSSTAGFIMYSRITHIDYKLILCAASAALIGGFTGNKIMYTKLKSHHIKKIIAFLLLSISLKMIYSLLF
jgi:hypothetical protein